MKTPAGTFKDCLRVEETSGIAPDEKGYKTYAPGVGLIQDEDLLLTGYREGKAPGTKRQNEAAGANQDENVHHVTRFRCAMRLLLIEDYRPLRQSLTKGLHEAGFAVDATATAKRGCGTPRATSTT